MHISEGVLTPAILAGGAILAAGGVGIGLRQMKQDQIPTVGMLSAAFFVASLIHVPIGPASAHLVLNGLLGLLLGWMAFPAILVGTALQAILFQFGGLTTLGVNTLTMALPAVLCHYLFGRGVRAGRDRRVFMSCAFLTGFLAVLITGLLVGLCLYLVGEAFLPAAQALIAAHIPVMFIEGGLTAACALFLSRVRPELLEGIHGSS